MPAEHYSTKQPTSRPIQRHFRFNFNDVTFSFASVSGTFSVDGPDTASLLLLRAVEVSPGERILDLGCGWGLIGLCLAKTNPVSTVIMADINERAVAWAEKNRKINSIENAKVICSDQYEKVQGKFHIILTNPPLHAGKKVCLSMITEAKNFLQPNGKFYLVARHQKGGRSLSGCMKETFENVSYIVKKGGVRVYCSVNEAR